MPLTETSEVAPQAPSPRGLIVFIIAVLILGSAGFFALQGNKNNNSNNPSNGQNPSKPAPLLSSPISPHTLVYGGWTGNESVIKSVDLSSGENKTLAQLPLNIKKVSVISSQTILYIDQTDERDHGTQLVLYSLKDKKPLATIPVSSGFGIDDYVVSQNKQFVAVWEVSFAQDKSVLVGGHSRVYALNLDKPDVKNLIYDESASTYVHTPRVILNDGRVITDKFVPNDPNGQGWAYGVSLSSFDGATKQDLSQMQNGTYGTPPVVSPDGKKLIFTGYNGASGPGAELENGFRRAISKSNTIDTLDIASLERKTITNNLPSNTIYSTAGWADTSADIVFNSTEGLYAQNLASGTVTKLNQTDLSYVTVLSSDKILLGAEEESASSLGNLGDTYASSIKQFSIQDAKTAKLIALNLSDNLMQYISLLPANYFPEVLGTLVVPTNLTPTIIDLYSDKNVKKENLQLYTFYLKAELAPKREIQQTAPPKEGKPRCRDLAAEQCKESGQVEGTDSYKDCVKAQKKVNKKQDDLCYDSPLYLYGKAGQSVEVKVHTPVYNSVPEYNNGYSATLQGDGGVMIGGSLYESISYDYRSALRRLTPPAKGAIVAGKDFAKTVKSYAGKLGLNDKETKDIVAYAEENAQAPYVFVSFFDHKTSHGILPLSFTPAPDNYQNIVFYFARLKSDPGFIPESPVFPRPVSREGLTAIEVSAIVE